MNAGTQLATGSLTWIDSTGATQATRALTMPVQASQVFTPEQTGELPVNFVGSVELASDYAPLCGVVTHFDRSEPGTAAFERGNEHYQLRSDESLGTVLDAATIVQNGNVSTTISILTSSDAPTATVTIQFRDSAGIVQSAILSTVVGSALFDLSAVAGLPVPFVGSARILSDQPIAAFVSLYSAQAQGGYSAAPVLVNNPGGGVYPNLAPTADDLADRTLYVQNGNLATVLITATTRLGILFTATVPSKAQFTYSLPVSKAVNQLALDASGSVNSLVVFDSITSTVAEPVRGTAVYPMLIPGRDLTKRDPFVNRYCAVAPTVLAGFDEWQTSLRLLNPLTTTGVVTITYRPSQNASTVSTPVVVTQTLPAGAGVTPDFSGILGHADIWSAYLESTVPFYGDATSKKPGVSDGLMTYPVEPIACVNLSQVFVPFVRK
jgi:hypothetical protein